MCICNVCTYTHVNYMLNHILISSVMLRFNWLFESKFTNRFSNHFRFPEGFWMSNKIMDTIFQVCRKFESTARIINIVIFILLFRILSDALSGRHDTHNYNLKVSFAINSIDGIYYWSSRLGIRASFSSLLVSVYPY